MEPSRSLIAGCMVTTWPWINLPPDGPALPRERGERHWVPTAWPGSVGRWGAVYTPGGRRAYLTRWREPDATAWTVLRWWDTKGSGPADQRLTYPPEALAAWLAQHPEVARVTAGGSAARGQMRADSDVDLWVEVADDHRPPLLAEVLTMNAELEAVFGRRVDLMTVRPRRDLPPPEPGGLVVLWKASDNAKGPPEGTLSPQPHPHRVG